MAGDVVFNDAAITFESGAVTIHNHGGGREVTDRLASLQADVSTVLERQGMDTQKLDALSQNLEDMGGLVNQFFDLITSRDEENARLKQEILDLTAGDAATQEKIEAAFKKSEEIENKMREKIPGVPPVGGTALLPSYSDRSSFDSAVSAYTGPEAVTVDGSEVKSGTSPSLDYFSHSTDGSVSTSGPTD